MSRKAAFIYEESMSRHQLRGDHPMRPVRLQYTFDLLQSYGAFDQNTSLLVPPRAATEEELGMIHTAEYVAAVRSFSQGISGYEPGRFNFSAQGDNPMYRGMYDAAALSSGASLVAIKYLLEQGLRVAYLDIDAHHGDGVQEAFFDNGRVLTISIHESGQYLFPGTGFVPESGVGSGEGYSVNLPLYPYTGDEIYLSAFHEVVPPLIKAFAPDVLVTQLGIDTYHSDPLTHLQITTRGYVEAVKEMSRWGIHWVALGGGGYDLSAVARSWALAYGVMLDVEWPDDLPASLVEQVGGGTLRDTITPSVPDDVRLKAQKYAEDSVERIKERVFPTHSL